MAKQNLVEKMKKDIEICKDLIKKFFKEIDYLPISEETRDNTINSKLVEYFSEIDRGKWMGLNNKRFGIPLEKALIDCWKCSEVFERKGKNYRVDMNYSFPYGEKRLFSAMELKE